ncbi:MAG: hypothetical protein WCL71_15860 [Deltaproteobacteria bacterium]
MNLFGIYMVDSATYRLSIQLVVFFAVGLVTLKMWRYYCRNPFSFIHYIFLFFLVYFLQTAVKLSASILHLLALSDLLAPVMPMLDHVLKMGWVILFIYAFIVTISGMQSIKQYFLITNLFLIVFISSTVWLNWLLYLDTSSLGQRMFGLFWGELLLEAWVLLLLLYGLFIARRVHVALKGVFLLALTLLISQLLLHSWNIISSHKQLSWTFTADRMLTLLISAVTMVAVFRYRNVTNAGDGKSRERDSGLVRDQV